MEWFGRRVKDIVTGFSGVAIGYVKYHTDCNQILVAPTVGKDGAFRNSQWFDEQRVKLMGGKRVVVDNHGLTGPDRAAPKR